MPCTFTALSVVHSGTFALPSQLFIDCLSGMGVTYQKSKKCFRVLLVVSYVLQDLWPHYEPEANIRCQCTTSLKGKLYRFRIECKERDYQFVRIIVCSIPSLPQPPLPPPTPPPSPNPPSLPQPPLPPPIPPPPPPQLLMSAAQVLLSPLMLCT